MSFYFEVYNKYRFSEVGFPFVPTYGQANSLPVCNVSTLLLRIFVLLSLHTALLTLIQTMCYFSTAEHYSQKICIISNWFMSCSRVTLTFRSFLCGLFAFCRVGYLLRIWPSAEILSSAYILSCEHYILFFINFLLT